MKKFLLILLSVYSVFGLDFYTLENGGWSLDGETPTELIPGMNDDIYVMHDVTIDWLFELNRGSLTVMAPATLTFTEEVIFKAGSVIEIQEGSQVIFERDFYNFSSTFENYGDVYYHEFIYNFGNIQSWGNFSNGSNGRKFHNFGQFNDIIDGEGPHNQQAYKDTDLNNSTPNTGDELPVVWGEISADYLNASTLIVNWEIFSEKENDYFYIIASVDAINWDTIGVVNGRGTASTSMRYSIEIDVYEEYKYVGVGQFDFNGDHEFGGMTKVNWSKDVELNVNEGVYTLNSEKEIVVYNELGQILSVPVERSNGLQSFKLDSFPKGLYIIVLNEDTDKKVFKVAL